MSYTFIGFKEKYRKDDEEIYINIANINTLHSSSSPEEKPCTVIHMNNGDYVYVKHTLREVLDILEYGSRIHK